jgi:hypothetical protein
MMLSIILHLWLKWFRYRGLLPLKQVGFVKDVDILWHGHGPAKPTCLNKVRFKVALRAFASHGSVDHLQRFEMQQWRLRCRWLSRTDHRLISAKTFDLSTLSEIAEISLITPRVEVNAEE